MVIPQIYRTMRAIRSHPRAGTVRGLARHARWHLRRLLGLFPFEQTISRSRIVAPDGRCGVSAVINNQGMYDWNNMHLLQTLLAAGGTFLDIGANIGSYALVASEQPRARVHALEPHPSTCLLLRDNVALNHRANVTVHNLAAAAHDGTLRLTDIPGSTTNRVEIAGAARTIEVPCVRMDTFCERHSLIPDYIKIDVEGFEPDVLAGFGDALSRVRLALVELGPRKEEAVALLARSGFGGPYSYDHGEKAFFPFGPGAREDPVFLSPQLQSELSDRGLSLR